MTVAEFITKWRKAELKERSAAQEHFLDLCNVFEHPTPAAAYGWPADLTDEAILERLLALNQTASDKGSGISGTTRP